MFITVVFFYFVFRNHLNIDRNERIKKYPEPKKAVKHKNLFVVSTIIFILTIVLIVTHSLTGLSLAFIGCIAAFLSLVVSYKSHLKLIKPMDWKTLLFFIGLFICVGGLERVGILEILANWIGKIGQGNAFLVVSIIMWASAFASAILDNIPFAATMVPVIFNLSETGISLKTLSWSLALGTDIGGNATPIGASANVVGIAIAEKKGYKVGWARYCKYAIPAMIIVMIFCNIYLYIRYF